MLPDTSYHYIINGGIVMKNTNEIQRALVDAEIVDDEIQRNLHSRNSEEDYGGIMAPDIAKRLLEDAENDKMSDAYLKVFLLRMSRDIHTIKICVLIFSILALAGLIIGLLLSIGSLGVVTSSTI